MAKAGSKSGGSSSGAAPLIFSLLTVFLLGAVAAGGIYSYSKLQHRVSAARSEPVKLVIEWPALAAGASGSSEPNTEPDTSGQPATWLSEPYRFQVSAITSAALTSDPYDQAALERAAAAIVSTGWVKSVTSIRREPGGVIRVRADWRTPAAVVRFENQDYLVSTDGDLLPAKFAPGKTRLRVIFNPSYNPPENPGERWLGGDVQAGLALLAQLQTKPKVYQQVAGVDVSKYVKSRRLSAVSDRGGLVVWGVPPGESRVGEPSTDKKMALMERLLADPAYGRRIDAGQPLVDLTSSRGILIDASARPLLLPNPDAPLDEPAESVQPGASQRGPIATREPVNADEE